MTLILLYFFLITETSKELDSCEKCVSTFAEDGGCECMKKEDCDQFGLISKGCFKCGDIAMEYCDSRRGKDISYLVYHWSNHKNNGHIVVL